MAIKKSRKVVQSRTEPNSFGESKVYLRYQYKSGETQKDYSVRVAKARESIQKHNIINGVGKQNQSNWYWVIKPKKRSK